MFESLDLPVTTGTFSFVKKRKRYNWRNNPIKADCHPDQPNEAKGLCKSCYDRKRRLDYPNKKRVKDWRASGINITVEEYNRRLEQQGYRCAICNITSEENGKIFAVDHCHTTNKIRGLLCDFCNKNLALDRNTIEVLLRTINYLYGEKD